MNLMQPQDPAVANFMRAAADLLQSALERARRIDSAGVSGLANLLASGGMLSISATLAPSTSLAQLAVTVIDQHGEAHPLMACELHRQAVQ